MTPDTLPDGAGLEAMLQLLRHEFPDAVVATIDSAAFFSLDETHWPNFATVREILLPLIAAGHDRLAARTGGTVRS